jgi:hypothetical protein
MCYFRCTMTFLEALAILEAAVLECKKREFNTPEITYALNLLEPYIRPEWLIPQFRHEASDGYGNKEVDCEGQQQALRATSPRSPKPRLPVNAR